MVARYLIQLVVVGSQAVGRAFRQALRQEYQATVSARQAAEDAGRSGIQAAKASNITGMSLSEAKQILNVKDLESMEIIKKNYNHLFKVNAKSAGGSFYLQSKVVRACERIEMELNSSIAEYPSNEQTKENS